MVAISRGSRSHRPTTTPGGVLTRWIMNPACVRVQRALEVRRENIAASGLWLARCWHRLTQRRHGFAFSLCSPVRGCSSLALLDPRLMAFIPLGLSGLLSHARTLGNTWAHAKRIAGAHAGFRKERTAGVFLGSGAPWLAEMPARAFLQPTPSNRWRLVPDHSANLKPPKVPYASATSRHQRPSIAC